MRPQPISQLASFLLVFALSAFGVTGTFQWDHDSLDDCQHREETGKCTSDATTFYQCPLACTKKKQSAGGRTQGEVHKDPDAFFELSTPLPGGKTLEFDRFEGYVTLLVVIPLMPGMAQYYYDMMEHIHGVYPYTLEILVFPIRREDNPDFKLQVPDKSKVIMLPELMREGDKIESNDVLEYVERAINPDPDRNFIFTDRVTTYLVSYNSVFIEKSACPRMDDLEKLVAHYLTEMDWKQEL